MCTYNTCVIHIDPLPIPTLKPSTPASIRFLACWAVTTEREREGGDGKGGIETERQNEQGKG